MKISCVQFSPQKGEISKNLETMESLFPADSKLVIYPELATTGYLFEDRNELVNLAETCNGESVTRLTKLAKKHNSHIVFGFAEKKDDKVYNSAALISPDGVKYIYRKVHLFDRENFIFTPGDEEWSVQDVCGLKIGIMICFDWLFPEASRTIALKGADIICHPSNLVLPFCQDAMITRCLENRIFAATANRVGEESIAKLNLKFTGKSQIVSPFGERLALAGERQTEVISCDINPDLARNKYVTKRSHLFEQRVPKLYKTISKDLTLQKPYRKNVAIIVSDMKGKVLVGERINFPGVWQFPQGGVDAGETFEQAMFRELGEEIGTNDVEIIAQTSGTYTYDFPESLNDTPIGRTYCGQTQKFYLVKLKHNAKPDLKQAEDEEFSTLKWISPTEILEQIVDFKRENYQKAFDEFKSFLNNPK